MSKVVVGIAEAGLAAGLAASVFLTGGADIGVAYVEGSHLFASLLMAGASSFAGAIGDALVSNRGTVITTRQSNAFGGIVYGERAVGGELIYQSTTASSDKTYNQVIALAKHTCAYVRSCYLDGRYVYFAGGSGQTTRNGVTFGGEADDNTHYGPAGEYNFGGNQNVYLEARYGDQTSANKQFMASLQANDSNWAPGANGTPYLGGITYVYLKIRASQTNFPGRPETRFVVGGYDQIYDPRTGTYGYTNNLALVCLDIILNKTWGLKESLSNIDLDSFIAAANLCDEEVSLAAGGSEFRYRANIAFDMSTAPGDMLQAVLGSADGYIGMAGGLWTIKLGSYVAPTYSFGPGDLTGPVNVTTSGSYSDRANRVRATFTAPFNPYSLSTNITSDYDLDVTEAAASYQFAWASTAAPFYAQDTNHGYASDQWLTQDGEILYKSIDLKACLSLATAQRLSKVALLRNRLQNVSGTLPMWLRGYSIKAGDTFQMTLPQLGWVNKVFEVTTFNFQPGYTEDGRAVPFSTSLQVREISPDIHDWDVTEELTINDTPAAPTTSPYILAPPTSMALDSGANTAVIGIDGVLTPRVSITWDDPQDVAVTQVQVQFKLHSSSTWLDAGLVDVANFQTYVSGVIAGQVYDFRIRSLRPSGAASAWVEQDSYTVSTTYSSIASNGLAPNIPANTATTLVLDSIAESGTATIRLHGSAVGDPWNLIVGSTITAEPAASITGQAFSTVYYVVLQPSTGDFFALTDHDSAFADQYIYVGALITCASDGSGGSIGGDGGVSIGGKGGGTKSPPLVTPDSPGD